MLDLRVIATIFPRIHARMYYAPPRAHVLCAPPRARHVFLSEHLQGMAAAAAARGQRAIPGRASRKDVC